MDMNKLRRELDSIKGGMEDINRLLLDTETASEDLVSRLAALGTIGNKKGIIRSIVTRATAGIPSVYQLMQQLSSMLLVFKYISVARNEDLKEEQKMIDTLENRSKVQKRIYKLNQALAGGHLSALEKEKFYNDASIKHMMRTMSFQEALTATSKKFLGVKQKVEKIDDKVFKRARKQFVRDNYGTKGLTGGSLTGKAAILMADDQTEKLKLRKKGLKEELTAEERRRGAGIYQLNNAETESEKREAKANLSIIEARMEAFSDAIENVTEEIQVSAGNAEGLIRGSKRKGFRVSGKRGNRTFTDLTPHEKFMQKVEKIKLVLMTKLRGIQAGLKMFFNKGNMKMLGNAIKLGASFLGKALFIIMALGLLVFALHKMNFFATVKDIFDKIGEFYKPFREIFTGALGWLMEGVPLLITGVLGLISGLFGGDGEKVWVSLKKIGEGLLKTVVGLLGVVILGAINIGMTLLTGLVSLVAGYMVSSVMTGIEALKNILTGVKGTGTGMLSGAVIGGIGGAIVGGAVGAMTLTPFGIIAGAKVGGTLGATAGASIGAANPMASGGTNLLGGNYLVGDNGPEIISLPGGSSITNNTNTRSAMGNTINVHVNGRVGASDQELNEIARKIGSKINIEMNRFNSRGFRA